ncbi:TolC family protein [Dokdonella sp.]|uniref:TolC family protein n=1 Tax=Dokdonella sp. TaxID=2291710 RepID=UPI002F3F07A2
MKRWSLFLLLVASSACASDPTATPDLPQHDSVARWLEGDPGMQASDFERARARHEAGMLRASPNEWTINATGQRRRYDDGGTSREWNAGLERTIRLPGKRSLDTQLGRDTEAIAEARQGETRLQAVTDLVQLWLTWSVASAERRLVDEQVELVGRNRDAVEKRVKAGDAARLELNLAEADRADIERLQRELETSEAQAKARLGARFAELPADPPLLSQPLPVDESLESLKAALVSTSMALQVADAELRFAESSVERERADRLPDPTIGVFGASEAFGNERIVGLSLSVPLPGEYRSRKLGRALSVRDMTEATLRRERQRVEADAAARVLELQGRFDGWRLAKTAADRSRENATLTQRAYALGEADLQTLLLARRQSLDASRTAARAQFDAVLARYRVALATGGLWSDLTTAGATTTEEASRAETRLPDAE